MPQKDKIQLIKWEEEHFQDVWKRSARMTAVQEGQRAANVGCGRMMAGSRWDVVVRGGGEGG